LQVLLEESTKLQIADKNLKMMRETECVYFSSEDTQKYEKILK